MRLQHFDYVGGPRNYKWINTVILQKTWHQMNLAYARNARTIWVVNVGDLKPLVGSHTPFINLNLSELTNRKYLLIIS